MGKNIIPQRRGRGGPRYRAPSFRYVGEARHRHISEKALTGTVTELVHCPGHSAPLASVVFEDGEEIYMPASEGMCQGDMIKTGPRAEVEIGNTVMLNEIPEGTPIYNIEAIPGDGGKFARASGTCARVVGKSGNKITVALPSKKEKTFDGKCRATIGIVAGGGRPEKPFLKAGTHYYKMKQRNKLWPIVCGQSMNAVAHPHGGSRSSKKGKHMTARRFAPPGAKVGLIRPRMTGRARSRRAGAAQAQQ